MPHARSISCNGVYLSDGAFSGIQTGFHSDSVLTSERKEILDSSLFSVCKEESFACYIPPSRSILPILGAPLAHRS